MRNHAILTVGLALAMLGPVSAAVAVTDTPGCSVPASPVDIDTLTASSDGTFITVLMVLCATLPPVPTMDMADITFAKTKPQFQVLFDYVDPLASGQKLVDGGSLGAKTGHAAGTLHPFPTDHTCVNTREIGMKLVLRFKKSAGVVEERHGKGTIVKGTIVGLVFVAGGNVLDTLKYTIRYTELKGLSMPVGKPVEIWAISKTKKSTKDRVPNTSITGETGTAKCSFPQKADEVLQIVLSAP